MKILDVEITYLKEILGTNYLSYITEEMQDRLFGLINIESYISDNLDTWKYKIIEKHSEDNKDIYSTEENTYSQRTFGKDPEPFEFEILDFPKLLFKDEVSFKGDIGIEYFEHLFHIDDLKGYIKLDSDFASMLHLALYHRDPIIQKIIIYNVDRIMHKALKKLYDAGEFKECLEIKFHGE